MHNVSYYEFLSSAVEFSLLKLLVVWQYIIKNDQIRVKFLGRLDSNEFQLKRRIDTHYNWKNQILGAVLELPAKQHCQFSPFCLASSSKTGPRILIFSIAMGADYSF